MNASEMDFFKRLKGAESIKPTAASEGSSMEQVLKATTPDADTPLSIRNLFTHQDTHPLVLDFALLKTFGLEWLGWESVTVFQEIRRVFSTEISEHARSKIQAIKTLHVSNAPWNSWQVLEKVIQALNNNVPKWEVMQAPTLDQMFAAIDIMDMIERGTFSEETKMYLAAAVLNEDVFFVPPPLDFFQAEVAQPKWVCKDCGNEDSALFHDGVCDTCTHRFSEENGLTFEPDPEAIAAGRGKNTTLKLTYDPDPVEARWEQVKNKPSKEVELEENQVDVQVAKLLVARDYMNIRRRQLQEQLTALKSWLGAS